MRVERKALKDFSAGSPQGHLITNPPYGERMGDRKASEEIVRELGALRGRLDRWAFHVISPAEDFERLFGRGADSKRELMNGQIRCRYYEFYRR